MTENNYPSYIHMLFGNMLNGLWPIGFVAVTENPQCQILRCLKELKSHEAALFTWYGQERMS